MTTPPTDAGAEWLVRHASWIRDLARSLVSDSATADDLVQDTWVAALTQRPTLDRPLRPWLRTVLENFARARARARCAEGLSEVELAQPTDSSDPEELCEELEAEHLLTAELSRLEEPLRSTLLLRYYRGLEPSEIARLRGEPAGTVRWRLKRGLQLLRERLDARLGGEDRSWSLVLLPLARSKAVATGGVGSGVALTGILAMNTALKLAAVAAVAAIALVVGLSISGVLPDPPSLWSRSEQPLAVSFRSIESRAQPEPAPVSAPVAEDRRTIAVPPSGRAQEVELPGPAVATVAARIVDPYGRGLAGGGLRVVTHSGPGATVQAGSDGSLLLELEAGEQERGLTLEAFDRGFTSHAEAVRISAGRALDLGTITLQSGGAISGRIVSEGGRAIAGALVGSGEASVRRQELEIRRFLSSEPDSLGKVDVPQALSNARGEFTLDGLPEGFLRLWARAEGRLTAYTPPVEVRSGQESYGIEIVFLPIGAENRVRGVVLDPAGAPVPYADLDYTHRSADLGLGHGDERRADADGSFELTLPADAVLSITARDPQGRYGPASADGVRTGQDRLVLRLSEGRRIELIALAADGAQLEAFGFEVLSASDPERVLQSGARGEESASFLLPGDPFLVRIKAPMHQLETLGPLNPATTEGALQARLGSVPGLRGVVRAGKAQVTSARISLHSEVPGAERFERNGFRCWMDPSALDEVESDDQGAFVLTVRSSGSYFVRVEKDGYAPTDLGPLALDPARNPEPIELRLGPGGALAGRVIPPLGEEATGTLVALHRGDGHARTARVGRDGAYLFEGLTPGPWRLETRDEDLLVGYSRQGPSLLTFADEVAWNCEVHAGETTLFDLVLADPDALVLHATLRLDGVQPETLVAWLCPADEPLVGAFDNLQRWPQVSPDPKGCFELGAAEPGTWRLVVKHASASAEWVLVDEVHLVDTRTPWELDLKTGTLVIEGLPILEPNQDVAPLVLAWDGGGELRYVRLILPDESGVCTLEQVPAGTARLMRPSLEPPVDPDRWPTALSTEIKPGAETRVIAP